jgi:hypothetical protein
VGLSGPVEPLKLREYKGRVDGENLAGLPVEESNLTVSISKIRKLLGDGKERQKYIATLPRRSCDGNSDKCTRRRYRFMNNHQEPLKTAVAATCFSQ